MQDVARQILKRHISLPYLNFLTYLKVLINLIHELKSLSIKNTQLKNNSVNPPLKDSLTV